MTQKDFERRMPNGGIKEVRLMPTGYHDDFEEQAVQVRKTVAQTIAKQQHAQLQAEITEMKKKYRK